MLWGEWAHAVCLNYLPRMQKSKRDRFESDVEGVLHRASYWLMMTSGRTFYHGPACACRAMTPLLANPLGGNYHRWSWRTLVRVYHIEWVGGHALYFRWKRISLCSNRLVPRAENDWVRTRLFSTRNWGGTLARVYSPLMCVAREATFSVVRALPRDLLSTIILRCVSVCHWHCNPIAICWL